MSDETLPDDFLVEFGCGQPDEVISYPIPRADVTAKRSIDDRLVPQRVDDGSAVLHPTRGNSDYEKDEKLRHRWVGRLGLGSAYRRASYVAPPAVSMTNTGLVCVYFFVVLWI